MEMIACLRMLELPKHDKIWGIVRMNGQVFTFNGKTPNADRPVVGIRTTPVSMLDAREKLSQKYRKGYEEVTNHELIGRIHENVQPQVEANI